MGNCAAKGDKKQLAVVVVERTKDVLLDAKASEVVPLAEAVILCSPPLSPAESAKLDIISKFNIPDMSLLKTEMLDINSINSILGNIQHEHNQLQVEVDSLDLKFTTDVLELEKKFQIFDSLDWYRREDAAIKIEKQELRKKYRPDVLNLGLRDKTIELKMKSVQFHLKALLNVSVPTLEYEKLRLWANKLQSEQRCIGCTIRGISVKLI